MLNSSCKTLATILIPRFGVHSNAEAAEKCLIATIGRELNVHKPEPFTSKGQVKSKEISSTPNAITEVNQQLQIYLLDKKRPS